MKKILILGAGFLQSFIIKKAKEIGYYTIAIDKNPNAVGFLYADEHEVIDIIDREACLKYARLKNIDGVITVATDYGVLSSAYIAEQMNLPGLRYEIAKAIKNKYLVRRILFENKIDDISQYFEINSKEDLTNLRTKIKFPVIVKPCDGSGSKGVRRVDSFNELEEAYIEAMNISLIKKVLIEEFVEGKEYGIEAFVYNGEIYVLGVIEKYMTSPPCYAELGHALPNDLTMEEENKIREVVKKAIRALGINFGAVNMDLLFTKDKHVCIVDVGARMGGNLIGSHIIQYGSGINYMDVLIRAAMERV